jgi:serine/threonine protein kinase
MKEFAAEVKVMTRLRHRNIIQLLGWCDGPRGLLLVYEFMPNGSLDKALYDPRRLLTWSERYVLLLLHLLIKTVYSFFLIGKNLSNFHV